MSDREKINKLFEKLSEAANMRDVVEIMSLHYESEVAFVFGDKLDKKSNRQFCSDGYSKLNSNFTYDFKIESIEIGERLAYAFGEEVVSGTAEGIKIDNIVNATYCLKKIDGEWKILHQHLSQRNA